MKYKLLKPTIPNYSAIEQILFNRGIDFKEIYHYLNTTDNDINSYELLNLDKMKNAAAAIFNCVAENKKIFIVVDSDCDGFTSSALLINYLYDLLPEYTKANVQWYIHSGKQHGLSDCVDVAIKSKCGLVITPDAGSNDIEQHKILSQYNNIPVICLDHHEIEGQESKYAIIINNQCKQENYPNKDLSGVGVTWQFCRFLDKITENDYSSLYLDLVALGLTADMMSLQSFETKHLINKGFRTIQNPFIYRMWQKNRFKLGEVVTSWGAAFYIAPFVNAMVRSGTQEEKELLFNSMLKFKAFEKIESTKRGHKGEIEELVEQAVRTCTNVKNRQTKIVDATVKILEQKIEEEGLFNNHVLLFLVKPGEVDKNVAGLVANKMMAKYQRPCCILTENDEVVDATDSKGNVLKEWHNISYQGSARGCDVVGVTEFKDICANTGVVSFVAGHQGAFGLGIPAGSVATFLHKTNEALKDISQEPIYRVDYIYKDPYINSEQLLDIASMDSLWGKDMEESMIAIEDLKITKDMLTIYKGSTIKISTKSGVDLMLFNTNEDMYDKIYSEQGFVKVNIVGKANANEWNGNVKAQVFIEDIEITESSKYLF